MYSESGIGVVGQLYSQNQTRSFVRERFTVKTLINVNEYLVTWFSSYLELENIS